MLSPPGLQGQSVRDLVVFATGDQAMASRCRRDEVSACLATQALRALRALPPRRGCHFFVKIAVSVRGTASFGEHWENDLSTTLPSYNCRDPAAFEET